MFGFLGKLFGSDKAVESMVNNVSNGLDKLVYTDEEKANDAAKDRSEARRMVVGWMKATSGQNLARRLIALSVVSVWLADIVLAQIAGALAIFSDSPEKLNQLAEFMLKAAGGMDSVIMLVISFYFAAPHLGQIAKAVTGRFSKDVK